jgi:non-heme chloroperoxidase
MLTFATTSLATPTARFDDVRLSNGVRLHYAQQGPQTGPALLLLHGYTDSWFSFSRVLPLFRPDLRVIVPDLRGHGDSSRPSFAKASGGKPLDGEVETGHPTAGYRIVDLADDVLLLMEALKVPNAIVVGHSMGSFVARRVAALAGGRITKLILVGAGPSARTKVIRDLKVAVDSLTDPVDPEFVREFQAGTVFQPPSAEFMAAVIENSRRMPAAIWKALLNGLIEEEPPAWLATRTLVLGGRQDTIFPPTEQNVLARQFARGELELVDGVGHTLHWESPARFMSALARFGV